MLMLAGALGGGILLGAMVGSSKSRSSSSGYTSSRHFTGASTSGAVNTSSATYTQKQRASETIDNIKAGLIAFATAKAKEFLNQALPGFDTYVRDAESHRQSSQFSSAGEYNQSYNQGGTGYGSGSYNQGGYNPGGYGQQTSGQGQGANYGQNYGTDYGPHGTGQRNYSGEQSYRNS